MQYLVFGGVLSAPLSFPELRELPDATPSDWTLTVREGQAPAGEVHPLGEDELAEGIHARLGTVGSALRLEFDDTGIFDVHADGRIAWYPAADCDRELVRVDILGRVLAVCTHMQGLLCLHGSAVAIGDHAVAFLAHKGSGKSTLAMALAARGARLLTDDTLPVDAERAIARPGVHSVRLWTDAAEQFSALGQSRIGLSDKRTFDVLPDDIIQHAPLPLAAVYELIPRSPAALPGVVRRTTLLPAHGAIMLMQHSKLGALLGGAEALAVFDRAVRIASRIGLYRLEVASDLDSLGKVAETIIGWHR